MSPFLIIGGVAALLIMFGAGVALFVSGDRSDVDERLEQFVGGSTLDVAFEEVEDESRGPDMADRLDKALSRQSFFDQIKGRISRADVKLRVSEYIITVFFSGIAVSVIVYFLFDNSSVLAVVGFILGLRIPRVYLGYAARKRISAFDDQLSDTLNLWVNALRSGYSVLQGMEAIATELPPPVSVEFERVVQEVRLGLGLGEALDNMYRRVPSEDLDLVITAVNIQREVGGNLAEVLDNISFTIRERVRIKGEVRTLTAQGRISGWIISLLPLGLGFLMYLINPRYIEELWVLEPPLIWDDPVIPCGWLVIAFGLMMMGGGIFAIRKIVDIEI